MKQLIAFSVKKKQASLLYKLFYLPCVVDSMVLLLHFTPTIVASWKIRKRLILKKLLPLEAPFQHFRFPVRFRVRFRFQPFLSKCFRFHKKINLFQLPLQLLHP